MKAGIQCATGCRHSSSFASHTYGLPTDERTLPQALKDAGYRILMDGKWHLGHADKKYWPQNRGFDYFYGNVVGEVDYDEVRAAQLGD
jgi:arylsulfatase A-like enzyme